KTRRYEAMIAVLLVALVLALPSPSWSAVLTFTDRAAWLAAVGSVVTETFEGVSPVNASTAGDTFSLPNFDIIIDANHGSIRIGSGITGPVIAGTQSFYGDVHAPGTNSPQFQTFDFGTSIFAFGADWGNGDSGGVTLEVGGVSTSFDIPFGSSTFFGIISDTAF